MKKVFLLMGIFFCLMTSISFAADLYPFQSSQKRKQFARLTNELRCMVCQNENLAASNATFAMDLRTRIYQMVQSGQSDQQIKHFMTARYGNFILFNPPFVLETYLLWFAPLILVLFTALIAYPVIRKYRST